MATPRDEVARLQECHALCELYDLRLSRMEREPEPGCGFADFSEQLPQERFRRVQDDPVVHVGVVAVHTTHGLTPGVDASREVDAGDL